jgi:hypothetical protein
MRAKVTLGRAAWFLCACLLLLPSLAAAAPEPASHPTNGHERYAVAVNRGYLSVLQLSLSSSDGPLPQSRQLPDNSGADDNDAGTTEEIAIAGCVLFVLALCAAPRAPAAEASRVCAAHAPRACSSIRAIDPFSPRPPPTHVLL